MVRRVASPDPCLSNLTNTVSSGLNTSRGIDPNPSINVYAPTPPPPDLDTSQPYIPPTEREPSPRRTRAVSQPPPSGPRKSVAFAEKPEVNTVAPAESETSSPEKHRHHSRRERGYEAGDDTDSTPDETRRRPDEPISSRNLDPTIPEDNRRRRHHRRRRSADASSNPRQDVRPSRESREDRTTSPADSDATVELPARFDEKGRKRSEDPFADKIDDIMKGKGTAGKLFGNFVDGIFGPEGRKKGR